MLMPMMEVWQVWVCMPHFFVHVLVNVRLRFCIDLMRMLMVFVMNVDVRVYQWFMLMRVGMRFRQHQPGCDGHQHRGDNQSRSDRLTQQRDGKRCADERGSTKMRSGARRPKMA